VALVFIPKQFNALMRQAVLRYSIHNRRKKAEKISKWMKAHDCKTVLFVGVVGEECAGDPNMANADIVEMKLMSDFDVKMGVNIYEAKTPYPFMIADARELPFDENYVDCAFANAIIEHVGGQTDQERMISEMTRVARCWVITTPNLWFPVESHTSAVFSHWRRSWRQRHADDFTRLLSLRQFRSLLPTDAKIDGHVWSPTLTAYYCRQ
jgi:hypothetical protein